MHKAAVKSGKKNKPEDQEYLEFLQVKYDQLNRKGIINSFQIIYHDVPVIYFNRPNQPLPVPFTDLLTERQRENYFA
jgi:hypothetical protein